ncbi:unnamed protein product, partial [Ilex paraguariensis]
YGWAEHQILIESDSQTLVQMVLGQAEVPWRLQIVMEKIRCLFGILQVQKLMELLIFWHPLLFKLGDILTFKSVMFFHLLGGCFAKGSEFAAYNKIEEGC